MSYPGWGGNANDDTYSNTGATPGWSAGYWGPSASASSSGQSSPYYPAPDSGYPAIAFNQQSSQDYQHAQYVDPRSTFVAHGAASSASAAASAAAAVYPYSASSSAPYGLRSVTATVPIAGSAQNCGVPRHNQHPHTIQLTERTGAEAALPGPGAARACSHCGTTTTPVWRRDPRTALPLCNACGVYQTTRGTPRPQTLIDVDNASAGAEDPPGSGGPTCSHCGTHRTSAWRRNKAGAQVCNACGVYERMNGRPRPVELRSDKVRPREKHRAG